MLNRPFPLCATSLHLLLLLGAFCVSLAMFPVSYAAVIRVPQDYPTIQAAINAAHAGDTIQVSRRLGESQSVYYERIIIDKQLIIVGESRDTVIIDGNGAGTVVTIRADGVQFKGFTVRNGGLKYSGIRANSYSYLVVANTTVKNSRYGIALLNSLSNTIVSNIVFNNSISGISLSQSVGNNVSDNDVAESTYGIELSSANATVVVGNTVRNNSYGINIEYSHNNTVDKNVLVRNRVDGILPLSCYDIIVKNNKVSESAYGIRLYQSYTSKVVGNNATSNSYGFYLAYSGPSNNIVNNTSSRNDWGIILYSSSSNTITGNTLSYNTYGVDTATDSSNNVFYHNNFVENAEQASWNPYFLNTWDNGAEGNYWSDYTGTDANNDGIGDTPYVIDSNNQDRYPLMSPWPGRPDVAVVSVSPDYTSEYVEYPLNITVVVKNEGTATQSFLVTAYYNSSVIGTKSVTGLVPNGISTLVFTWNTVGVKPGNYTLSANALPVQGEVDLSDNVLTDGTVHIKIRGDINGDRVVDILDAGLVSAHWYPGPPVGPLGYDRDADINRDGRVDIVDLAIINGNWLRSE